MTTARPNLLTRDDTFFGVCEGLGEDLRIPPNLLRLGFGLLTFASPVAAVAGYAGAGVLVAVSRWLFPAPPLPAAPEKAGGEAAEAEPVFAEAA